MAVAVIPLKGLPQQKKALRYFRGAKNICAKVMLDCGPLGAWVGDVKHKAMGGALVGLLS